MSSIHKQKKMLLNDQIRHIDYFLLAQNYNWLCGIPISSMHCRTGSQNALWETIWVTRKNLILRSLIQFFCQTWENNYKIQKNSFCCFKYKCQMCYLYTLDLSEDMNLERDYLFLSIITHSSCLSTARDKWSICAAFLGVGTKSQRKHSQESRVIKCDSTIHIIRLPLPALAEKVSSDKWNWEWCSCGKMAPHLIHNTEYFTNFSIFWEFLLFFPLFRLFM